MIRPYYRIQIPPPPLVGRWFEGGRTGVGGAAMCRRVNFLMDNGTCINDYNCYDIILHIFDTYLSIAHFPFTKLIGEQKLK